MGYVTVDLSCDENKYVSRYIGNYPTQNLRGNMRKLFERLLGEGTKGRILIRRKTFDELIDYSIKRLDEAFPDVGYSNTDPVLRKEIANVIHKGTSALVRIDDKNFIDFIIKW